MYRLGLSSSRWRSFLACVMAGLLLACGGGVDTGGTGAPAQSFSSGHISGFGSVIVNGVRFDEANAVIVDEEGASQPRSALTLGMVIDVEAGPVVVDAATGVARSTATRVQFGNEIAGPVQAVQIGSASLVVLGQTVKVDADTVFDGLPQGLASVSAGQLVEMFGFYDVATASFMASRIELRQSLPVFKLRGIAGQLDTASQTFAIGAAPISYADVPPAERPMLANGLLVRVQLQTTTSNGAWVATRLRSSMRVVADGAKAELEGFVSDFASAASFRIHGVPVDASGTGVEFKKGTIGQIADGVRLEVEGEMHDGVLVARKVHFKKQGGGEDEFELEGEIESADAAQLSFVLRGVAVSHDANTKFTQGSAADLVVGTKVEVKGVLAAGGTRVLATKIKFGD